ncbi:MAG: UvrD-helicase domain-containing protein, partial [Victivallales bacterium]|nr:UvrD-helicase domain-containing protein [Victivallales bacterium]
MNNQLIFSNEIFKRVFPLEGAHLVAASAGTGKTYNIQNIYARLIMEKGWRVSEIQVMTFTEAATKELRERLRAVLADVQLRLDGQPCHGKDADDIARRNERADNLIAACQTKSMA